MADTAIDPARRSPTHRVTFARLAVERADFEAKLQRVRQRSERRHTFEEDEDTDDYASGDGGEQERRQRIWELAQYEREEREHEMEESAAEGVMYTDEHAWMQVLTPQEALTEIGDRERLLQVGYWQQAELERLREENDQARATFPSPISSVRHCTTRLR